MHCDYMKIVLVLKIDTLNYFEVKGYRVCNLPQNSPGKEIIW